jgi:hypothetical protein
MSRELFTTWADYQTAIDRVLALASKRISIYDEDLGQLHLETPERLTALKAPFASASGNCLRIALRNVTPLQQRHPQLLHLLATYGHKCAMQQTPDQLAHIRDSMILVDDAHAVIRFDRDHPRGKLLVDESDEVMPYRRRFEEIWAEGGTPVAATTLGL